MQPVVYSETAAAMPSGCGWHRSGTDVRYKPGRPRPKPTSNKESNEQLNDGGSKPDDVVDNSVESEGGLGVGRYRMLRKRLLRAQASLTSRKQGALTSQTVVDVTEVTRLPGKMGEKGALRGKCVAGWFTMQPELMELVPIDTSDTGTDGVGAAADTVRLRPLLPKASFAMDREPGGTKNDAQQQDQHLKKRKKKTVSKKGDSWADTEHFYQLEFTLVSEHGVDDTIYIAMAVPYSYTKLQRRLEMIARSPHVTRRQLCTTRGGRRCDVVTVTQSPRPTPVELSTRLHVVLSARVHPGETNASWLVSMCGDRHIESTLVLIGIWLYRDRWTECLTC
jgi:hypothetical protein